MTFCKSVKVRKLRFTVNKLFLSDPLDGEPPMVQLVKFLKPVAPNWQLIGMCLRIKVEEIPLAPDMVIRLVSVLDQWERSRCSPYTWRNILDVVEGVLDENNVADEIKTFLQKKK